MGLRRVRADLEPTGMNKLLEERAVFKIFRHQ